MKSQNAQTASQALWGAVLLLELVLSTSGAHAAMPVYFSGNLKGNITGCGCKRNPVGGLDRRWNVTQQKPPRLTLDSGDLFYQATPVPPFLAKSWEARAGKLAQIQKILNGEAPFIMVPGELDLAAGIDRFRTLASQAGAMVVAANIYDSKTGKPAFPRYKIISVDWAGASKKHIAVFGVYDESLPLPNGFRTKPHIAEAAALVHELKGRADFVIALTHLGFEKDQILAQAVPGLTAIFGGHSGHLTLKPLKIGSTLIFHPGTSGDHVGLFDAETTFGTPSTTTNEVLFRLDRRWDVALDKTKTPRAQNPVAKLIEEAKFEESSLDKK